MFPTFCRDICATTPTFSIRQTPVSSSSSGFHPAAVIKRRKMVTNTQSSRIHKSCDACTTRKVRCAGKSSAARDNSDRLSCEAR